MALHITEIELKKRWNYYNYETNALNRWTGEGSTNEHPRLNNADQHNELMNAYWLEDGSYLRIRNVQLGYTLPKAWIQNIRLQRVRAYVSATNLYTFTSYSGFTPDVTNSGNPLITGVDMGYYPLTTTYSFGLNVTF